MEAQGSGHSSQACVMSLTQQQGFRVISIRAGAPRWGLSVGARQVPSTLCRVRLTDTLSNQPVGARPHPWVHVEPSVERPQNRDRTFQ